MSAGAAPGLEWRGWWPLALGIVVLLAASYVRFWTGPWSEPGNDHAPIIVAIAMFLAWRQRDAFAQAAPGRRTWVPALLLGTGIALFLLGVRTRIATFEALSHVPLLAGALWLAGGRTLVLRLWFALFFLLLSVPIPSQLLALATGDLKQFVSSASVEAMYRLGYPVGHDGAVLTVGHYRLLVAEACAGMNSIISLSAIGLFYLYLVPPKRLWTLALSLLSILPIAILANVVRIILLCLITYYLGDEAGQGFLHEFAGLAMFALALLLFVSLSALLSLVGRPVPDRGAAHA